MNDERPAHAPSVPKDDAGKDDVGSVSVASGHWHRLRRLLAISLVVGLSGAGYYEFWLRHPVGSGPAGAAVDRKPFSQVWRERPVLLLGFGDSVTAGFGASPQQSYFARLISNSPDDPADIQGINLTAVFPKLRSLNVALSGSTSIEHELYLLRRIPSQPPEVFGVVVATIGGNDIIHNYGQTPPREGAMYGATLEQARPWIEGFRQRLARLLDGVAEKFPGGCRFYLATIYDPTDGVGDAQNAGLPPWPEGLALLAAYNAVIEATAASRDDVTLIDMRREFLGHGIHARQCWRSTYSSADPHYWYGANLEDPNDRGYDALRRLFLNAIAADRKLFSKM